MSFLGEIRRRKIFQVAAVYAVVAWLLIQVVATVEGPLNLPDWVDTLVIVLLAVGFPITLIMSWGFNLTAEGFIREGGSDAAVATRPRRGIEYVLIGLIIVALFWLVYRVEFAEQETVARSSVPTESVVDDATAETSADVLPNSIAVLPFENLSPDPDNAFFAAGIHESTLNQLAKIRDLVVMSRTSVMQYEDDPPPIRDIAMALNVEMVMEGSVRFANERVLIAAQLIDGRTGGHLWSDEFNRDLTDVFAVQAEVAEQIAAALEIQLLPEVQARIDKRPTESAEAYQYYLRSLSMPPTPVAPEYLPVHIDLLNRAIEADPGFAEAYAELANVYYMVPAKRQLAVEYAEKALKIDPGVGLAHFVIGMRDRYYHARQASAREDLQRAIDLNPIDEYAVQAARHLAEQSGEYDAAIRLAQRAIDIDPDNDFLHHQLGFLLLRAGKPARAVEKFEVAIRLAPGIYMHRLDLAASQYLLGDYDRAGESLNFAFQVLRRDVTFRVDYLAYLFGLLGEPERSAELLAEQGASTEDPQSDVWETLGWAVLGTRDRNNALRVWTATIDGYLNDDEPVSLGRISRFRDNWLNDPMLEEPEFLELRRRLGYEG